MLSNKKIIVTGGAGFIGSNLAEHLSKTNDVTVIDDLSFGNEENLEGVNCKLVKVSITDPSALAEQFENVEYVFHLAANASVQMSVEQPEVVNRTNVEGTLNVLIAARNAGVKRLVFASSSAIYGDTPDIPKKEDQYPMPLSPYAVTKQTGELYCQAFNSAYGISTVSLRFFNVFGPRQDPRSQYAAVVPIFMSKLSRNEAPTIFGDGEQIRDFVYVRDVVKGLEMAAESDASGVYNICNGERTTVNRLFHLISKSLEKEIDPIYAPKRKGDIEISVGDFSKARDAFGYSPKYTLKSALEETAEWYLKN